MRFSRSAIDIERSASRAARSPRPLFHVVMTVNTSPAINSGNQPPLGILSRLAPQKPRSTKRKAPAIASTAGEAPLPPIARHDGEEDRREHHVRGHRHAVRRREPARGAEADHESDARDHQHPVETRDVDLAGLRLGGVLDVEARQIPELHGLPREGKRARDHRLRRDHRGERREPDEKRQRPGRREPEERVLRRRRIQQHERALTEVVQQQRREDEEVPRQPDRPRTEVAHVRVERFAAGHDEEHRAEDEEAVRSVVREEARTVERAHRREHARVLHDLDCAEHAERGEPDAA